jgi:hypothetical protein
VAKKWQFLYWDNAYGQSMIKWFTEELRKAGGEVVQGIPVPAGTADYSSYLAKLRPESEVPPSSRMAISATWRSPWRWRHGRACCCSTSRRRA